MLDKKVIRHEMFEGIVEDYEDMKESVGRMNTSLNPFIMESWFKINRLTKTPVYLIDFYEEFKAAKEVTFYLYADEFIEENPDIEQQKFGKIGFYKNGPVNLLNEAEVSFNYGYARNPPSKKRIQFSELKEENIINSILFSKELGKILKEVSDLRLRKPRAAFDCDPYCRENKSIFEKLKIDPKLDQYYKTIHSLAFRYDSKIVKLAEKISFIN
jgi:hypothetical protein